MANVKISALPAATTPLAGTEVLPIVQSGITSKVSVANLTAGRSISASDLTLTNALPIASGGTGQITANAAFNALAPSQTGNSGKYLTTDGSNTSWATNPLGTVTSVSGTAPVSVATGTTTPVISMAAATTSVNGYLTSTDWTTFNSKQATLVSGTNIKTVNGTTLLGSGDLGIITGTYGGTGINNGSNTITIAGNLTHTGAFTQSFTATANTAVTLPAGATAASNNLLSSATALGIITGTPSGSNFLRGDGTWATPAGAGTVTSVAQSFTGGLISVTGSPITSAGTLALTVAGTSGGIPYFSSGSTWATSAALAASALVIGGGAGVAPSTTTTGTGVVTALGVNVGSAGAFVTFNGALGTPSSGVATNLTGTASGLSIGGNAATATSATSATTATTATTATNATNTAITDDTTTATSVYPTWVTTTTGNLPQKTTSTRLSFVPSTGVLTATSFAGSGSNLTGVITTAGTGLTASSGTLNATGTTINSQTSAYVLVAGDAGKTVSITTGGVTVNNSVMSAGNIVSIYNNSGSSQTITQGTGVTMQWAGQTASSTGNRTLGLYGLATIVYISASNAVITGSGLT